MAIGEGEAKTSSGGIHGATANAPILQSKEKLQPTGVPNVSSAFNALALTPSALGEAASSLSMTAGNELARREGRRLGKNPEGDLLPAFTKVDQTFIDSYSAQAESTLGLQAQSLLNQSKEEISNSNLLTQNQIGTFAQKTSDGLEGILNNAPNTIKDKMQHQFSSEVESSVHQLTMKMIGQQKELAIQQANAWRMNQSLAMQNAAKDGNYDLADQINESINSNIHAMVNSNQMDPAQGESALITNKLNFQSSLAINKAMDARAKGGGALEDYLATMADKKIPGLSWSESEAVLNNVLQHVSQTESADRRQEQLTMAIGNNQIQTGEMTPAILSDYQNKLQPTDYVHLATAYAVSQRSRGITNQKVNFITANPRDSQTYNGMTAKDINSGFDVLTQALIKDYQNNGQGIDQDEAEFQTAAYMAHPVPKFVDSINNGIQQGNPQQAEAAMQKFQRMHEISGFKTVGVSDKSVAIGEVFQGLLGSQSLLPDEALAKARDIVSNKDDKTIKLNNQIIADYMKKNVSNPSKSLSWAIKMSGVESGIPFQNDAAFTSDIRNQFQGFMQLTNGDVDISKKMIQTYTQKTYGTTHVNGEPQIAYLPIEKSINLDTGATSLIQDDLISHLEPQLANGKEAFNNGTLPYYWRIKARISFDEYAKAKDSLRTKGFSDPEYAVHSQLTKKYEKGSPVEIEQVMRNNDIHTYNLQIQTTSYNQVSPVTGQVMGPYNVLIKDPITGIPSAIHGHFGGIRTMPEYRPDAESIRNKFLTVNGINYNSKDNWKFYEAEKSGRAERKVKEINALLRSFH